MVNAPMEKSDLAGLERCAIPEAPAKSRDQETERVRDVFEHSTGFWHDIYKKRDVYSVCYQDRMAAVLSLVDSLALPKGAKVLEVGCGAGLLSIELARRGFEVTAVD